mgnify:CR=1 FL=1
MGSGLIFNLTRQSYSDYECLNRIRKPIISPNYKSTEAFLRTKCPSGRPENFSGVFNGVSAWWANFWELLWTLHGLMYIIIV